MNNLFKVLTRKKLIKLGFEEESNENENLKKTIWNMKNDAFHLIVNTFGDVTLIRLNTDSEDLKLEINDLYELECVVDWVAEQKRSSRRKFFLKT
jgi:hypothetical protein